MRNDQRAPLGHKNDRVGPGAEQLQWRGHQQDSGWRDRRGTDDFEQVRDPRVMEWEPSFANTGWAPHPESPTSGAPPQHLAPPDAWNPAGEWEEYPNRWEHDPPPHQPHDVRAFHNPHHDRRDPFHNRKRDNEYNRQPQWQRNHHHSGGSYYSNNNNRDNRPNDTFQRYVRDLYDMIQIDG